MSIFDKVVDFFSGGIGSTVVQEISKHFPPGMSEADKAQVQMALMKLTHDQQVELLRIANESDAEFNKRIADLEGTASELKGIPLVGPLVLFLRGCIRPMWSYATMYVDFMWFSGHWQIDADEQKAALYIINVLVLGFWFGERALTNVLPYFKDVFAARAKAA